VARWKYGNGTSLETGMGANKRSTFDHGIEVRNGGMENHCDCEGKTGMGTNKQTVDADKFGSEALDSRTE
jgi:hypothetical protein